MKTVLTSIFIYLACASLFAQTGNVVPDFPRDWNNNRLLINPSEQDSSTLAVSVIQKTRTGPLKKIGFRSLTAHYGQDNHTVNLIGFIETEGPYISRPRYYLNYAYSLELSQNLSTSLGVSYGYVQHRYDAVTVLNQNNGGSDGALGLTIQSEKFRLGLSGQQLFNNTLLTGDNSGSILTRYYTFDLNTTLYSYEDWNVNLLTLYRLIPDYFDDLQIGFETEYLSLFGFTFQYEYLKGMNVSLQCNQLTPELPFHFSLLYRTNTFSSLLAQFNHFEVSLGYRY